MQSSLSPPMPCGGAAGGGGVSKTWIPVDAKIHWFSFLDAHDLARASRVCRSWSSLVQKTADTMIAKTIGAEPPALGRGGKLRFLSRLQRASLKENMGYLLAWAAGCREYTPFLHKLLLYRDTLREDLGLPGGLHESARPDAYSDVDEDVRALFTYRTGPASLPAGAAPGTPLPGTDLIPTPPLVVAAQRGNVDAVHLLLLFGEGAHGRRKANERALYIAAEAGNALIVAALLGRVPLRPPHHPPHIAAKLGLVRPVWSVYGPGHTYQGGVSQGPRSVPAAIAAAKSRAEHAAATGFATANGAKASATASAALAISRRIGGGGTQLSPAEAQVAQTEVFEADGRYRSWCHGYRMGTYWATYDTSLAAWEAIHGVIGGAASEQAAAAMAQGEQLGPDGQPIVLRGPNGAPMLPIKRKVSRITNAAIVASTTLESLRARLDLRTAPGSTLAGSPLYITASYAAQALLVSRLPPNLSLPAAARLRPRGHMHPRIPEPIDYGSLAAEALAIRVRINVGPVEGRTPLHAAVERGRLEVAYLLLSHHDPVAADRGDVPVLPPKPQAEGEGGQPGAAAGAAAAPAGGAAAAPGGGAAAAAPAAGAAPAGAPAPLQLPGVAAPGAPAGAAAVPPAVAAARLSLANIAQSSPSALAVVPALVASSNSTSFLVLGGSNNTQGAVAAAAHRAELLATLLDAQRDRADVDDCPTGYHTPLCLAAERGDERLVSLLLHFGAEPAKAGRKEATPLLAASMAGHDHIVRLLLRTCTEHAAARAVMERLDVQQREGGAWLLTGGSSGDSDDEDDAESPRTGGVWGNSRGSSSSSNSDASTAALAQAVAVAVESNSAEATFALLGLGDNPAATLRLALAKSGRAGIDDTLTKSARGTAASNAMGSTVAAQRGGGRSRGDRVLRSEDAMLWTCEPAVTLALAAAASGSGWRDEFGLLVPPRPAPYDASLHLPPEEAPPASLDLVANFVALHSDLCSSMEAPSAPKRVPFAQRALLGTSSRGTSGGGGGAAAAAAGYSSGSGGEGCGECVTLGGGIPSSAILHLPTSHSYCELIVTHEALRRLLRSRVKRLVASSRVSSGVGCIPGRVAPLAVDAGDESGYTSLFIMACAGKLASVQLLVAAGADCTAVTKRGKTPIYGAVEKCHLDIVEWLMPRYTATQLRANTTYGTNVVHAANKAGNARIRDALQAYCVEYDLREARQLKAERATRKKQQWGEGGEDGGGGEGGSGVGGEAAAHLRQVRKLADAARKREADAEARRGARAGGGGGAGVQGEVGGASAASDSDAEEGGARAAVARGRSEAPRAAATPTRSASVAPAVRVGGGAAQQQQQPVRPAPAPLRALSVPPIRQAHPTPVVTPSVVPAAAAAAAAVSTPTRGRLPARATAPPRPVSGSATAVGGAAASSRASSVSSNRAASASASNAIGRGAATPSAAAAAAASAAGSSSPAATTQRPALRPLSAGGAARAAAAAAAAAPAAAAIAALQLGSSMSTATAASLALAMGRSSRTASTLTDMPAMSPSGTPEVVTANSSPLSIHAAPSGSSTRGPTPALQLSGSGSAAASSNRMAPLRLTPLSGVSPIAASSSSASSSPSAAMATASVSSPVAGVVGSPSLGGGSVYERLAARARELENKRKAAEEDSVRKAIAAASTNGLPPRTLSGGAVMLTPVTTPSGATGGVGFSSSAAKGGPSSKSSGGTSQAAVVPTFGIEGTGMRGNAATTARTSGSARAPSPAATARSSATASSQGVVAQGSTRRNVASAGDSRSDGVSTASSNSSAPPSRRGSMGNGSSSSSARPPTLGAIGKASSVPVLPIKASSGSASAPVSAAPSPVRVAAVNFLSSTRASDASSLASATESTAVASAAEVRARRAAFLDRLLRTDSAGVAAAAAVSSGDGESGSVSGTSSRPDSRSSAALDATIAAASAYLEANGEAPVRLTARAASPVRSSPRVVLGGLLQQGGSSSAPGSPSRPPLFSSVDAPTRAPSSASKLGGGSNRAVGANTNVDWGDDGAGSPLARTLLLSGVGVSARRSAATEVAARAKALLLGAALGTGAAIANGSSSPKGPGGVKLTREEAAARDERNKSRETARVARIAAAHAAAAAAESGALGLAGLAAPVSNSLKLAAAAYGIKPKRR